MNGVVLLHSEPPEARMPRARWRLYVFKGEAEAQPPLMLHTASSYLLGRERRVATIPTDHLSCSKQARPRALCRGIAAAPLPALLLHACERGVLCADAACAPRTQHAVLQWRLTEKNGADGMPRAAVRLYLMARTCALCITRQVHTSLI